MPATAAGAEPWRQARNLGGRCGTLAAGVEPWRQVWNLGGRCGTLAAGVKHEPCPKPQPPLIPSHTKFPWKCLL
eukprot:350151-Chlamydomonas_euryale.AAC.2